jgi:hypothetical protein
MSLFKIILILSISFFASFGFSQQKTVKRKPAQVLMDDHVRVEFSYISWKEFVEVEPSSAEASTYGDFIGNAVSLIYEHYYVPRWGTILEGSLLFGMANLGSAPGYQAGNLNWWGVSASYRGLYRFSPQVSSSLGVLLLNRQIDYPSQTGVTDVSSGAELNYGLVMDLNYMLTPNWLIRQEVGGLFVKASTLWSIGVGYSF